MHITSLLRAARAGAAACCAVALASCASTGAASRAPAADGTADANPAAVSYLSGSMDITAYKTRWAYNADYDCYELLRVVYCASPADPAYESLNIYVPKAYVVQNGDDGIVFSADAQAGAFTAATAPIILCNGATGWEAGTARTLDELSRRVLELDFKACLAEGFVLVSAASRGPATVSPADASVYIGKAPNNVTDIKAAVRFVRANAGRFPGSAERIVSVGTSGAGGMSAIVGASGDSADFEPYLRDIGAVMDASDAVFATMAYCPITELENADLGYEWMFTLSEGDEISAGGMGLPPLPQKDGKGAKAHKQDAGYRGDSMQGGKKKTVTAFEAALSGDMAAAFERYVATLGIGYAEGDGSRYTSDLVSLFESALNTHLAQTYAANGSLDSAAASAYIASLNQNGYWLEWDGSRAEIAGVTAEEKKRALVESGHLARSKDITGFDAFGYGAEDKLFCAADGAPVHFSRSLADVLTANDARYRTLGGYTDYTAAFATAASEDVARRVAMLSPFHYLAQYRADSTSVRPSPHFRLTVGTADSNASPTAVFDLGKLAEAAGLESEYFFLWGAGHGTHDYAGGFVSWVKRICQ